MSSMQSKFGEAVGHASGVYARSTDVRVTYAGRRGSGEGAVVDVAVSHSSLSEVTRRKLNTKWCAQCKRGAHTKCSGRRRLLSRDTAPCECPMCAERRAA